MSSAKALKEATDFVNAGRALGIPDAALLRAIIASGALSYDQVEVFKIWFYHAS